MTAIGVGGRDALVLYTKVRPHNTDQRCTVHDACRVIFVFHTGTATAKLHVSLVRSLTTMFVLDPPHGCRLQLRGTQFHGAGYAGWVGGEVQACQRIPGRGQGVHDEVNVTRGRAE